MLVSILDTFEKNPCTRLLPGTLENLRKEIAAKIFKIPRFWKEANVKRKCAKINEVVKEFFYDEFSRKNVFSQTFRAENKLSLSMKKNDIAMVQTITTTTTRAFRRPMRTLDIRTSMANECNVDENTEEDQSEQQALPKLKTPVIPKEYRLKHSPDIRIPQIEKFHKDESLMNSVEKKSSLQNTLRPMEKGILVTSELMNGRELHSPSRTNLMIKDGKIQPYTQSASLENSKYPKKVPLQPPKDNKTVNVLEKKKTSPILRLPDLESALAEAQNGKDPFFLVIGSRNYMISQHKAKSSAKNSARKPK